MRQSTVIYRNNSTSAQTVYPSGNLIIGRQPANYRNVVFEGSGPKRSAGMNERTQSGASSANLITVYQNWTNSGGAVDLISSNVLTEFRGAYSQVLTGDNTTPIVFKDVIFTRSGTKTIAGGRFAIAPNGVMSVIQYNAENTQVAAGGNLTLQSAETTSATVGNIPAGSSITGNVNVERFVKGSYGRGYRLISSPVYSSTAGGYPYFTAAALLNNTLVTGRPGGSFDASSLNNPSLWLYREGDPSPKNARILDSDYKGLYSSTTAVPVGNGLLFFNRGNRTSASSKLFGSSFPVPEDNVLTQTGTLNQQAIAVRVINNDINNFDTQSAFNPNTRYYYRGNGAAPVALLNYTTTTTPGTDGFNLLGNPYPATIDMESVTFGTSVSPTVWGYNPANKQFTTYQKGTGASSNNGASRFIAQGQGFFVKTADNSANATVTFSEASKVGTQPTPTGSPRLLMGAPVSAAPVVYPKLMLRMVKDSVNYDGIGIYFREGALGGLDDYDAWDMDGISPQVYLSSVSDDEHRLAINMLPLLSGTRRVPLYVNAAASGVFSLVKTELDALPPVYDVWLTDRLGKDSLDLRSQDTYHFRIDKTDSATFGSERFAVIFRRKPLPPYQLVHFGAENSSGSPLLHWNAQNDFGYYTYTLQRQNESGFGDIYRLPSDGRGLYSYTDQTAHAGLFTYRLKQTDSEGNISYSAPVSINLGSPAASVITRTGIYPNPASDVLHFALLNTKGVTVRISDMRGRIIFRQQYQKNT
ncbi:MAG: T9SS type A sorting domain-containing protein, partial [Mucilaginibacter polytrichastri]|nr:T9SS type A sorting domain-containing protein [Mucilaginibacter polytrichastri]